MVRFNISVAQIVSREREQRRTQCQGADNKSYS